VWEGVEIEHSLNSKCLRVLLKTSNAVAQVEIKVARNVPTQVLSTRLLSDPNGFPPRLISVLDYEIALADKMVA
jgi:hypothetical protein